MEPTTPEVPMRTRYVNTPNFKGGTASLDSQKIVEPIPEPLFPPMDIDDASVEFDADYM